MASAVGARRYRHYTCARSSSHSMRRGARTYVILMPIVQPIIAHPGALSAGYPHGIMEPSKVDKDNAKKEQQGEFYQVCRSCAKRPINSQCSSLIEIQCQSISLLMPLRARDFLIKSRVSEIFVIRARLAKSTGINYKDGGPP